MTATTPTQPDDVDVVRVLDCPNVRGAVGKLARRSRMHRYVSFFEPLANDQGLTRRYWAAPLTEPVDWETLPTYAPPPLGTRAIVLRAEEGPPQLVDVLAHHADGLVALRYPGSPILDCHRMWISYDEPPRLLADVIDNDPQPAAEQPDPYALNLPGLFLRLDVPSPKEQPQATQYYRPESVYCITPTTEELARRAARVWTPAPVSRYELPAPPEPDQGSPRRDDGEEPPW